MPISVPRSVGQIPVYYNRKNPWGHNYVETTSRPLYPFGYGLSYTRFAYSDLQVEEKGDYHYDVCLNVKNTGDRDGEEVIQLYLKDDFASVVQPVKQLRNFRRVYLKKGETQQITFRISENDLSIVDKDLKRIVEPGTFTLMIGSSSEDVRLHTQIDVK